MNHIDMNHIDMNHIDMNLGRYLHNFEFVNFPQYYCYWSVSVITFLYFPVFVSLSVNFFRLTVL